MTEGPSCVWLRVVFEAQMCRAWHDSVAFLRPSRGGSGECLLGSRMRELAAGSLASNFRVCQCACLCVVCVSAYTYRTVYSVSETLPPMHRSFCAASCTARMFHRDLEGWAEELITVSFARGYCVPYMRLQHAGTTHRDYPRQSVSRRDFSNDRTPSSRTCRMCRP